MITYDKTWLKLGMPVCILLIFGLRLLEFLSAIVLCIYTLWVKCNSLQVRCELMSLASGGIRRAIAVGPGGHQVITKLNRGSLVAR